MRGLLSLPSLVALLHIAAAKVEIKELHVPRYVLRGKDVRLGCQFSTVGTRIYAAKWYKGKSEFYRYVPQYEKPKKAFPVAGFTVDLSLSDENAVQLRGLTPEATDSYMFEVISETPEFWTDHRRRNLTVVDAPEERPSISGHLPSYRVGDQLRVNCTSGPAMPAPDLTWYINGEEVPPHLIRSYRLPASEYLQTAVLQLVSQVRENFFRNGIMKLKCTSTIGDIYWQSTENPVTQLGDMNREMRSHFSSRSGGPAAARARAGGLPLLLPLLPLLLLLLLQPPLL